MGPIATETAPIEMLELAGPLMLVQVETIVNSSTYPLSLWNSLGQVFFTPRINLTADNIILNVSTKFRESENEKLL
jgi:hypothetical protein